MNDIHQSNWKMNEYYHMVNNPKLCDTLTIIWIKVQGNLVHIMIACATNVISCLKGYYSTKAKYSILSGMNLFKHALPSKISIDILLHVMLNQDIFMLMNGSIEMKINFS
ncbi:hypothetical protein ACJX0J_019510 [Zea mays]